MNPPIPLSAPDIGPAEVDAVAAVLRRSQLSLGPELEGFEQEFARFHGVRDAVAVSSGTAGLHLALVALKIGAGDEVMVPSFTFVAVANAVMQVGATPVFVEIDAVTLNIDPAKAEAAITPRTRSLVVVHTFGVPAEMGPLLELAQRFGLALIEDACEAIGATYDGQRVGTFGDASVFGFYPNKQMTTGEGGMVLMRDAAKLERIRSLRNQGRVPGGNWLDHAEPGYNYRLPEMACALGRVQLRRLSELLAKRQAAAERYDGQLAAYNQIQRPQLALPRRTISWFVYVVRLPAEVNRDRVQTSLAEAGIATGRYFPPIHLQPAWRGAGAILHLPQTEAIAARVLALPFFSQIAEHQQRRVVESLVEVLAGSLIDGMAHAGKHRPGSGTAFRGTFP